MANKILCAPQSKDIAERLQQEGVGISEALMDCPIIRVKDLIGETVAFSSTLDNNIKQTDGNLIKKRCLLVGVLTTEPKGLRSKDRKGDLFLADSKKAVVCKTLVTQLDCQVLDCEVIISEFNYVPHPFYYQGCSWVCQGHVEVTGKIVPARSTSKKTVKGLTGINTVSVFHARYLLHHRTELDCSTINVCGQIASISEVIRVHNDHIFLLRLKDTEKGAFVNVLVKDPKYLPWHNFLQTWEVYVFVGLRATTLHKGTPKECLIFTAWTGSDFYPEGHVKNTVISLQEWVAIHTGAMVSEEEIPEEEEEGAADGKALFTYKGRVTSTAMAQYGIYELDNKIRLYVSYIPAAHKFCCLRPGTQLTVYNSHHRVSKELPKLRLFCCLYGSIEVTGFSTLTSTVQPYRQSSCSLMHLVNGCSLSLLQFDWLMDMKQRLAKKLGPRFTSPKQDLLQNVLLTPHLVTKETLLPRRPRDMVAEFVTESHACSPSSKQVNNVPYRLVTISELLEEAEREAKDLQNYQSTAKSLPKDKLNEGLYWNYTSKQTQHFNRPLILIGRLVSSPTTGQFQLEDETGRLNCVIAPDSPSSHDCTKQCHPLVEETGTKAQSSPAKKKARTETGSAGSDGDSDYACPYAQTWNIGEIVRIDKFQVIMERFIVSQFPTADHLQEWKYVEKFRLHTYLQFSMADTVSLSKSESSPSGIPQVMKTTTNNIDVCSHPGMTNAENKAAEYKGANVKESYRGRHQTKDSSQISMLSIEKRAPESVNTNSKGSNQLIKTVDRTSESVNKFTSLQSQETSIYINVTTQGGAKGNGLVAHCSSLSTNGGVATNKGGVATDKRGVVTDKRGVATDKRGVATVKGGVATVSAIGHSQNPPPGVQTSVCQYVVLMEKDPLVVKARINADSQLSFYALVTFLGKPQVEEAATSRHDSTFSQAAPTRSSEVNTYQENNFSKNTEITQPAGLAQGVQQKKETTVERKEVILTFSGSAVRWFPLLFVGCVYRILVPNSRDLSLFGSTLTGALRRATEKCKARHCVFITEEMVIERVETVPGTALDALPTVGDIEQVSQIKEVRPDRSSTQLISFKGVVISRCFVEPNLQGAHGMVKGYLPNNIEAINTKLGVSVPDNRCIKLVVKDLITQDEVLVFMSLQNSSYPLGLLTRSVVEFRRFEKKLSGRGNIYCQFVAASFVRVLNATPSRTDEQASWNDRTSDAQEERQTRTDLTSTPQRHFIELYHLKHGRNAIFHSLADVQMVLKVALVCKCPRCGWGYREGRCSNLGCGENSHPIFDTKASVILDDGTGSVMAFLSGQTVQTLLRLQPQGWRALQHYASQHGALELNKGWRSDEEMVVPMRTLHTLCKSPVILRRMLVYCKLNPAYSNRSGQARLDAQHTVDSMNIEDFPLKTLKAGESDLVTRCLPFLQLHCVAMEEVNYEALATRTISQTTAMLNKAEK